MNVSWTAHRVTKILRKFSRDRFGLHEFKFKYFHKSIDKICSRTLLHLLRPNMPYFVHIKASTYDTGCIMFCTYENGTANTIGYCNRSMNYVERKYTPERETPHVFWKLETVPSCLQYETFMFYSYHHSLKWFFNITESIGRKTSR